MRKFKMKFRYNFEISNNFVIKIDLKALLIIKQIINLNFNVNEKVIISSLSVINDYLIINFKSNAFKTAISNEFFFKIKIELSRSLTFFSIIIIYFF